jgi:hypothetical protein
VLVLIWGLVLSGVLAWLLDKPTSWINTLKNRILF